MGVCRSCSYRIETGWNRLPAAETFAKLSPRRAGGDAEGRGGSVSLLLQRRAIRSSRARPPPSLRDWDFCKGLPARRTKQAKAICCRSLAVWAWRRPCP